MNDDDKQYQGESELDDLIKRFERMIEDGANRYFDLEEIEVLLGHYLGYGMVGRAQKVLKHASSLYPESLTLQLREAQILAGIGKHIQAVPRLKNLLAFEPNNEEIHLTLGSIYSQMREHHRAIKHFKDALKVADHELISDVYIDIAIEYQSLGEWKQAISSLDSSIKHDASNDSALFEIAYCYDNKNDMLGAINYFNNYLDNNPYSTAGWYNLGNAFHRLGKIKEAIDAYDFAIVIEENYIRAYHQKAEALTTNENYVEALEVYRETMLIEPATPHTLCCMGECLERLEEYTEAEEYYKQCLDFDSEFSDAYVGLGVLADLQSDSPLAVRFFEQAVLLEPDHSDFRLLLANGLMKLAKPKEAEAQFAAVLGKEPDNVEAWEGRIDNLQRLNAHSSALDVLNEGLKIVKDSTHLKYQRFVSIFENGDEAQALDILDQLLIEHYDSASRIFNSFPDLLNDSRIAERYNRLKP